MSWMADLLSHAHQALQEAQQADRETDALLTVKEYASLMGLHEEYVRELCRSGKLSAIRTCGRSGHWRIPKPCNS